MNEKIVIEEEKSCVTQLPLCKAGCCTVLPFFLNLPLRHPLLDYYEKRGIRVIRKNRGLVQVLVPHRCEQLSDDNLCKLHDTPDKPVVCKNFNEHTAKDDKYYIPKNCIYGKGGTK